MRPANRNNLRAEMTKERIRETFRLMILEMDYNNITITELATRVGIHRKTFYLHYECIDSLFLELEDTIIERANTMMVKGMEQFDTINFETAKHYLITLIETDSLLYKRLFFNESYQIICSHIYDRIIQLMTPHIKQNLSLAEEEAIIVTNFIITGYFEVIRNCQKNYMSISEEKLNRMLLSLINTGIRNI
ncbi:MAG: TetR/AcrR family transcriptional regulator [bacterium]|nr:TetR/AcrR family transcriptional regulator [bacterium]